MTINKMLSRRGGMVTGAKLAFAVPAIVAGLRGGVALADSGSGRTGTRGNVGSRTPAVAGARVANDTRSPKATDAQTPKPKTASNTTTTVGGERSELSVLGRARLCQVVDGSTQHRTAGQLRLLSGASGKHLAIRVRGGDDKTVVVKSSPGDALANASLKLVKGRAKLSVTDAQVTTLIVAGTKDFKSGLKFEMKDGDRTLTFVVCPHRA